MAGPLFEAGIRQVQAFDKEFYGENRTMTMSDRDVIYVTRSVIPLLSKYGVKGLTIGSNGDPPPPVFCRQPHSHSATQPHNHIATQRHHHKAT